MMWPALLRSSVWLGIPNERLTNMKASKIEWTTHTFNPWIGCTKVSPGCTHCYAETLMDTRYGRAKWGKGNPRSRTSAGNWKQPKRWDKEAAKLGERHRVFCASLADVFDGEVANEWRDDLWKLIEATPNLDWLLLTKRPEVMLAETRRLGVPKNVWLGVSVEDQIRAEERIPTLIETDAAVKFLSVEPLLGALDLSYWLTESIVPQLQWVIVGGESGPGARTMKEEWVTPILAECEAAGVAFLFKQWGGVDKHATGRTLNGTTYDALPTGRVARMPNAQAQRACGPGDVQ